MALVYKVNYTPTSNAEFVYDIKEVLKSAGWTVISSSNGSTFNDTDLITSPAVLTGGNLRWFIVQEPGGSGGREWCWQRGSNNAQWRVKISPTQGFKGGAPSVSQVPSATDETVIQGGGSDASPSWNSTLSRELFYLHGEGQYTTHIVADDTPHGPAGNQAYSFWAATVINTNDPRLFIIQEPLATGSYPPLVGTRTATVDGDADPVIYTCRGTTDFGFRPLFSTSTWYFDDPNYAFFYYFHSYSSGVNNGFVPANDIMLGNNAAPEMSTTPSSRQDVTLPIYIGRQAGPASGYNLVGSQVGYKGCLNSIKRSSIGRSVGTTMTTSERTYMYMGSLLFPWPTGLASRL